MVENVQKNWSMKAGFALPTVLIASIVLLMILTVSVSSVVAVRTALQTQYYEQLAKTAGEAGVAYARACLSQNNNVPLWSDAKPLKPNTDCAGNNLVTSNPFRSLVVAGGGGGGGSTGGGGGGGGVIETNYFALSPGSYPVVVGAGAAVSGNRAIGKDGGNSSFNGVTATGGGGGAFSSDAPAGGAGRPGGSGGGGQIYYGSYAPGAGIAGQGYAGGTIVGAGAQSTTGGGGSGGVGQSTSTAGGGGNGGPGKLSTITGEALYYGGGGGGAGAGSTAGLGGIGGGGNGGPYVADNAQPNTGGGGGGGHNYAAGNGGAGGSGIVVISYPNNGTVTATGGTITTVGAYKIHTFTSIGSTTFTVTSVGASSCPTDPRCSVTIEGNVRSSFSIGMPTLDAEGKAVAIPNTGYTELLRTSGGQAWRTYRQPSAQATVVPGECSGAATSSLGWSDAKVVTPKTALANAPEAQNISIATSASKAGKTYFLKQFKAAQSGTYFVTANTPSTNDLVTFYINGVAVGSAQGGAVTLSTSLVPGCYTLSAELTNRSLTDRATSFIAAFRFGSATATPLFVTDSYWRVSGGLVVDFSEPAYDAQPALWTQTTEHTYGTAKYANSTWVTYTGDAMTRLISPTTSGCPGACPANSYGYLRDSKSFYLDAPTEVQVSAICDDNCVVYIDGQMVLGSAVWAALSQQTVTLQPGAHHVGVRVYNINAGSSGTAVSVVAKPSNTVLTRTDRTWLAATSWFSSPQNIVSYEAPYTPSPLQFVRPTTMDVIVVAGGGGGSGNCSSCGGAGGGGAGGLIYAPGITPAVGSFAVQVGGGGAGGGAGSTSGGGNGGNSRFDAYIATGGGAGMGQNGTPGRNGGSGGGASGGGSPPYGLGGSGIAGQGFAGAHGMDSPYPGGGGGGANSPGTRAIPPQTGDGGPGFITYIDGTRRVLAGGGGGGTYGPSYTPGYAEVGSAGAGANAGAGGAGTANTGGGGGGGVGSPYGAAGGSGGSGVVYWRFVKGTITVGTISGLTYTASDVTINGITYTVYRFTAGSGTVAITAVN